LGKAARPLRVAIVGSGPSGFYTAERLQQTEGLEVQIDMFERLPTPFGLVRVGVAPDHQKIKSVTKQYEAVADHPGYRLLGCVEFGTHITREDLRRHYDAVVYAVGAASDRRLGIPGEDLPGSHPATEFVAWYNGHPDHKDLEYEVQRTERVVVVGNGNVAMDVARMLSRSHADLQKTDMADHALEVLAHSAVREVVVLGRRGPVQAAFTGPEVKELGELEDVDVVVHADEIELDDASREALENGPKAQQKIYDTLREFAERPPSGASRRIVQRFRAAPVELRGDAKVESVVVARNRLEADDSGQLRATQTGEVEEIEAGMVLRAVGYRGVPLKDVPFDERSGVIPNERGRLQDLDSGEPLPGEYVVGWIKRGPSGVIGTNRADARETVAELLDDLAAGRLGGAEAPTADAVDALLGERDCTPMTFEQWRSIDAHERERGSWSDRPRVKLTSLDEMREIASAVASGGD
jgi:ferredoxin--NADP+ reductase